MNGKGGDGLAQNSEVAAAWWFGEGEAWWRLAGVVAWRGSDNTRRRQQGREGLRWRKWERCGLVEENREEGHGFYRGRRRLNKWKPQT
ncbi:hypothetical protein GUJ93_ZPchr0004g40083 [Zizania palustris]|uniref:Uncharacterized protein n=1 Tax=Zizania palustris TaxID=103762 RepID=A0A8J5SBJ8_ZIZPA|nr:hypothetical protein GUJ93_ZPchr0004g40083 [Zizania palustris]